MTALAVVLTIFLLIALLRFGVSVVYGADGFIVKAQVGLLRVMLFPRKEEIVSADKETKRKARKEEKALKKIEEKKPGGLKMVLDMLPAIKKLLGRLRRRLLIKRLIIHYTAAGDDPSKTALSYGATNAVFGTIVPVLENNFRIRRRDFRTYADFEADKQSIYINAAISMAVWEAIYIVFAIVPPLIRIMKKKKTDAVDATVGKEVDNDGKNPDK